MSKQALLRSNHIMNNQQIIEVAKRYREQLEARTVNDRDRIFIKEGSPDEDAIRALCYAIDKDTSVSSLDYQYQFVDDALDALVTLGDNQGDEADPEEASAYLPERVYTSEFTAFLDASNYHVEYVTKVLEEYEPNDGFNLLSMAYRLAQEDALYTVVNTLRNQEEA